MSQRVVDCGTERRDCLDQAWTRSVAAEGNLPIPLGNATTDVAGLLDALKLDAIVLTGGNDIVGAPAAVDVAPERDRFERAALAWAHDRDIPVLGVCRGLQMLATEAGATLASADGHVATQHAIVSAIPGLPAEVNSFHRLAVVDPPASVEVLARAADGGIEALRLTHMRAAAVMWHPERPPIGRPPGGPLRLLEQLLRR